MIDLELAHGLLDMQGWLADTVRLRNFDRRAVLVLLGQIEATARALVIELHEDEKKALSVTSSGKP